MKDIVRGAILAAERIDDATALNLGTIKRIRMIDAAQEVLRYTGHKAQIKFLTDMPTGPLNRVADISLAKKLLDWEPETEFINGLRKTIDWYFSAKDENEVRAVFENMLTQR